jgi:Flp pilus assembly pilin Flp
VGDLGIKEWKMNALLRFIRDEEGISSLEYALLAVVVAMVIWVGAKVFGDAVSKLFSDIGGKLGDITIPDIPG